MSRSADRATAIVNVTGWLGLIAFLLWQEFRVEGWVTKFWFRIPVTVALALILLVFVLEILSDEMTVRRWAVSAVVFAAFAIVFLIAGAFGVQDLHLSRWVLLPAGAFYGLASFMAGAGARDLF